MTTSNNIKLRDMINKVSESRRLPVMMPQKNTINAITLPISDKYGLITPLIEVGKKSAISIGNIINQPENSL